jgi:hypothetical protein
MFFVSFNSSGSSKYTCPANLLQACQFCQAGINTLSTHALASSALLKATLN